MEKLVVANYAFSGNGTSSKVLSFTFTHD